jgi:hypothetical protein
VGGQKRQYGGAREAGTGYDHNRTEISGQKPVIAALMRRIGVGPSGSRASCAPRSPDRAAFEGCDLPHHVIRELRSFDNVPAVRYG